MINFVRLKKDASARPRCPRDFGGTYFALSSSCNEAGESAATSNCNASAKRRFGYVVLAASLAASVDAKMEAKADSCSYAQLDEATAS